MSQVNRSFRALAVGCALLAVLAVGCSKKSGVAFDPDAGHPDTFFATHGATYLADAGSCEACHGADLLGGIAKVSCASTSVGEQSCHAGGPGGAGHGAGWAAAASHGSTAKQAPGTASGFAYCERCHGSDFKGGTAGQSCFPCHGWNAPHGKTGWDGGGSRHQTTNTGNAAVCAQCHKSTSGTPGCFNGTLCHTSGGHPSGWSAASQHGAKAKSAPGSSSGFSYCESCHGSGLNGGSAKQSCLVNSGCHGWDAPHAKSGWDSGGSSHRTTNTGNATVCAQCHQSTSGTPGCFNGTLCHTSGGGHPSGWSAGSQHGATAKSTPGSSSGFLYCESCHGSGLNGGSAKQSCLVNSGCHGWSAPHANTWDNGGSSHRTTNEGNATVCSQCHQSSPGTPGCFNNTLCHGSGGGHPSGWSAGSQHGAAAKSAPGSSSGFLYCESCHGSGLNGGSANQSCLINSGCHGWSAPHANTWDNGGSSHRSTNTGNASVCSQCHQSNPGTAGCFNNTLCHGSD